MSLSLRPEKSICVIHTQPVPINRHSLQYQPDPASERKCDPLFAYPPIDTAVNAFEDDDYEAEVKEMLCDRWLDDHNNGIHYDAPWTQREFLGPRSYELFNKNKVPLFDAKQLKWLNASQKTKESMAAQSIESDIEDDVSCENPQYEYNEEYDYDT